ncbi:MFS transporter [Enterobacter sp. 63]
MTHQTPVDHWKVVLSACLISSVGALMFCVSPLILGIFGNHFSLNDQQLGYLLSSFYMGFFLIATSSAFWIRRVNWRVTALAGISITSLALFAINDANSYQVLLALMIAIGVGMGISYALATQILSDSSNPDRVFGIKLTFENLPGTALLLMLPVFVVPKFGLHGVVTVMAVTVIIFGLTIVWLPKRASKIHTFTLNSDNKESIPVNDKNLVWYGIASIFLFALGLIVPWTFMERIGVSLMFTNGDIGLALTACMGSSILGGLLAALIGERIGQMKPIIIGMTIYFLSLLGLGLSHNFIVYAVSCSMLLFTLNFVIAYQLGVTTTVDYSGNLVVLSASALSCAMAVGPAIGGNLIKGNDYTNLLIFSGVCGVASLGVYSFVCLRAHVKASFETQLT